jgi:hypothetical protein
MHLFFGQFHFNWILIVLFLAINENFTAFLIFYCIIAAFILIGWWALPFAIFILLRAILDHPDVAFKITLILMLIVSFYPCIHTLFILIEALTIIFYSPPLRA